VKLLRLCDSASSPYNSSGAHRAGSTPSCGPHRKLSGVHLHMSLQWPLCSIMLFATLAFTSLCQDGVRVPEFRVSKSSFTPVVQRRLRWKPIGAWPQQDCRQHAHTATEYAYYQFKF
jgi:hypothetical protein